MLINPYVFGYTPTDANAIAYIAAVEAADGIGLEAGVKKAIDNFVIGCKADGIWTAIKASCILAGARTLSGALVPLVGTAPTNNGFVSGNYNRKTGLQGNTANWLNSNRADNSDPQNNSHLAVYTSSTSNSGVYIGADYSGASDYWIGTFAATSWPFRHRIGTYTTAGQGTRSPTGGGFIAMSRNSSTLVITRVNSSNESISQDSATPGGSNIYVFSRSYTNGDPLNLSNACIAFYSIGTSLNLALLDSRVTTLINAIAAAIP